MNQEKNNMMLKPSANLLLTASALAVVGATSFFAGTKFQQSRILNGNFGNKTQVGQMMNGRENGQFDLKRTGSQGMQQGTGVGTGIGFGRPTSGEVIAMDEKSITVKSEDGSTKIVLFSDQTTVNKTEVGAKTDLKAGDQIMVIGSQNQDGSLTAQVINLGGGAMRIERQTTNQ